jgi:hypothetical protein
MHSQSAMDDIPRLPQIFVVSATSHDADHRLQSAMMACRQAGRGAVAFSSHWGAPEILVETGDRATSQQTRLSASLELAARATQLLRTVGLIDCFKPVISPQRPELTNPKRQPPLIRVSIPAHFGVELMLLAGAVLHPLHDRQVLFMALCGTIDAALRDRFDSSSLEDLKRYANQLPKHRMADLYPLFCLIGAWCGVARGVLDRVFTEETIVIRHAPAISARAHLSSVAERPQDATRRLSS